VKYNPFETLDVIRGFCRRYPTIFQKLKNPHALQSPYCTIVSRRGDADHVGSDFLVGGD
jgi:hypothetical protein